MQSSRASSLKIQSASRFVVHSDTDTAVTSVLDMQAPFSASVYQWQFEQLTLPFTGAELMVKSFAAENIGTYTVRDEQTQHQAQIKLGTALCCHAFSSAVLFFPSTALALFFSHTSSSICECIFAVKSRLPFKWCPSCGKRNHAHNHKCCACAHDMPIRGRPAKKPERGSSLTLKNYEDKLAALVW
jgi:hypothetical protein